MRADNCSRSSHAARFGDPLAVKSFELCQQRLLVGRILTSTRAKQHTDQMINAWSRMTIARRVYWVMLTVAGLGFVGRFLWHYDTWPFSLVWLVAIIFNGAGSMRGRTRHPQENDPNRR
jgi:hypothetical protein